MAPRRGTAVRGPAVPPLPSPPWRRVHMSTTGVMPRNGLLSIALHLIGPLNYGTVQAMPILMRGQTSGLLDVLFVLSSILKFWVKFRLKSDTNLFEIAKCKTSVPAIEIENEDLPGLSFKTHPYINKELFNNQQIFAAKDPNRSFPSGQNEIPLVKWRIQELDESSLPSSFNCLPLVSGNEAYLNIEYKASEIFDLHNIVITVPLPALRDAPRITMELYGSDGNLISHTRPV